MRISTNRTNENLRQTIASAGASGEYTGVTMQTATTHVSDPRRSIFIEIRERGADSVLARADAPMQREFQRRSSKRAFAPVFDNSRGVYFKTDIALNEFCEVYFTKQGVTIQRTNMQNVATPYRVRSGAVATGESAFIATPHLSVYTTFAMREQFTRDCYHIAQSTDNPMYKIATLKVMEQFFIEMTLAGKIARDEAELRYERFDKIQTRIWRGATPSEQATSFRLAFASLAKACGVNVA